MQQCLEGNGEPIEFRIDGIQKRAELSFASKPTVETRRERAVKGKSPKSSDGFAVEHLRRTDTVRLMVLYNRKWNGCVVDVEIGGYRTLIQYFNGVCPEFCRISGSGDWSLRSLNL